MCWTHIFLPSFLPSFHLQKWHVIWVQMIKFLYGDSNFTTSRRMDSQSEPEHLIYIHIYKYIYLVGSLSKPHTTILLPRSQTSYKPSSKCLLWSIMSVCVVLGGKEDSKALCKIIYKFCQSNPPLLQPPSTGNNLLSMVR
jgi:hypothetical protein